MATVPESPGVLFISTVSPLSNNLNANGALRWSIEFAKVNILGATADDFPLRNRKMAVVSCKQ